MVMHPRGTGPAVLGAVAWLIAACGSPSSTPATDQQSATALPPLALQVQNSGLHGGYLWLGSSNGVGRWHRLGQAELLCVTCPVPMQGAGFSYDVIVYDETCRLIGRVRPGGGSLRLVIDLGPKVTIRPAPPPGDWMPGESPPIAASTVPCTASPAS